MLFTKMLEVDEGYLKSKHYEELLHPLFVKSSEYASLWGNIQKDNWQTQLLRFSGKDSKKLWFKANYLPIHNQNKQLTRIINFATDVTQEVQRDKQKNALASELVLYSVKLANEAKEFMDKIRASSKEVANAISRQ